MRPTRLLCVFVVLCSFATSPLAHAASPKKYQVTGQVLQVDENLIVVQKGDEKFEIARSADTEVSGDLKVGGKVTVYYTMTASKIESKDAKK